MTLRSWGMRGRRGLIEAHEEWGSREGLEKGGGEGGGEGYVLVKRVLFFVT